MKSSARLWNLTNVEYPHTNGCYLGADLQELVGSRAAKREFIKAAAHSTSNLHTISPSQQVLKERFCST